MSKLIHRLSIKVRLPLLMGALLLTVIAASTWSAYQGVRQSELDSARERLQSLTEQLSALLQQSAASIASRTETAANESVIRSYVDQLSSDSKQDAAVAIKQLLPGQDRNTFQVELWSVEGGLLLAVPDGSAPVDSNLQNELKSDSLSSVGVLRVEKGSLAYPSIAEIKSAGGQSKRFLVRWRHVAATPQSQKQLTNLVGSNVAMYLGNRDNTLWSDLLTSVDKPPIDVASNGRMIRYNRQKVPVLGMSQFVQGTPWEILIEFPEKDVLAKSGTFFRRITAVGLVLLSMGIAAAFLVSRGITRPLMSLTTSAAAISGGDYSRVVNVDSRDELGTLASSFNNMLVKVRDSQLDLERKVQERTLELEKANKELEAFSHRTSDNLRIKSEELESMTQQLWQASKLATMGELAASIAHELNNPLATIALHADLLKTQSAASPQTCSLDIIISEGDRMAKLVNDLLEFSRRSHRQVSTVDVREEILNSVEFIHYHLRNRRIEITTDFPQVVPAIQADRQQLRQLFLNLLTNASDAMPTGGSVSVRVSVQRRQEKKTVKIQFADSGEGIAGEDLAKVWDPFFTTKPAGKGTGLGLAICRTIVEEHMGEIAIESKLEVGTTVTLWLPASE
ncbi:MAG: PAS domain-containing sensor histidine kinase [Pyrinomonadaceae bacterium]